MHVRGCRAARPKIIFCPLIESAALSAGIMNMHKRPAKMTLKLRCAIIRELSDKPKEGGGVRIAISLYTGNSVGYVYRERPVSLARSPSENVIVGRTGRAGFNLAPDIIADVLVPGNDGVSMPKHPADGTNAYLCAKIEFADASVFTSRSSATFCSRIATLTLRLLDSLRYAWKNHQHGCLRFFTLIETSKPPACFSRASLRLVSYPLNALASRRSTTSRCFIFARL